MQKITITESGKVSFIKGANCRNVDIFYYDKNGKWDEIVEEFEVIVEKKDWDNWKGTKQTKSMIRNIRKKKTIDLLTLTRREEKRKLAESPA